jgi:nucleoside-diphosphate-sugar epimerase
MIGSNNLVKRAAQASVSRLIEIGTCFEYNLSARVLSIDTQLKPTMPYSECKAALFMSLMRWLPEQNDEFAWCRLFYLYGEDESDGEDKRRLVPHIRTRLEISEVVELTCSIQIRDYLKVKDVG